MTTEQHHAFCNDLGDVLRKHNITALVGCWFGKPGTGMGVVDLCGPLNFELENLLCMLREDMRQTMQQLRPQVTGKETKGLNLDKGEKN